MKKFIIIISLGFLALTAMAQQSPTSFSYQAVVRNASGLPVVSANITLRFTIREGSSGGTIIYQEMQSKTTTSTGLVTANVGQGTMPSGPYPTAAIWAQASKFLQVEIDPSGGSNYLDMGTTQIMSVPFASFADGSNKSNTSAYADSAKKSFSAVMASTATTATNFSGTVNTSQIAQNSAANGEVLKWNGTQWAPATDVGGGSGDNWGTQSAKTDATLTGNGTTGSELKIAQQGAGTGDVMAWNGTNWAPAAGGSVWTKTGNNISNNNSGNVGINQATPLYKLDVTGNTRILGSVGIGGVPSGTYTLFSTNAADNQTLFESSSSLNNARFTIKGIGSADFLELVRYGGSVSGAFTDGTTYGGGAAIMTGTNTNKLVAGTLGAFPIHLMTAGKTRLFISKEGKIGINKTTPKASIDFFGSPNSGDSTDPGWGAKDYMGLFIDMDTVAGPNEVSAIVGVARKSKNENNGVVGIALGKINSTVNAGVCGYANNNSIGTNVVNYGSLNVSRNGKDNYGCYSLASGTTGSSTAYGVYGFGTKATNAIGVYGSATSGTTTTYGGYFTAGVTSGKYAAAFMGDISITGVLAKGSGTFKIDHPQDPENKYLIHSFVESPDMMNVYNGNITTDAKGFATVSLPTYFQTENVNFKYQLTVIGQFAQAIVFTEVDNNQFQIQTDKPNVKVSWQVTGVRNDKFAVANPVIPELEKSANDKGKYIHPELFGKPITSGIYYAPPPALPKQTLAPGSNN